MSSAFINQVMSGTALLEAQHHDLQTRLREMARPHRFTPNQPVQQRPGLQLLTAAAVSNKALVFVRYLSWFNREDRYYLRSRYETPLFRIDCLIAWTHPTESTLMSYCGDSRSFEPYAGPLLPAE